MTNLAVVFSLIVVILIVCLSAISFHDLNAALQRDSGIAETHQVVMKLYDKKPITYSGNGYQRDAYIFIFVSSYGNETQTYKTQDVSLYTKLDVGKEYNVSIWNDKTYTDTQNIAMVHY
jgi:hypothetical protein